TSKFAITVWGKSDNKSTINNFSNSGTIEGGKNNSGLNIANESTIETFSNSGVIQAGGDYGAVYMLGSIKTFTNTGTIKSTGTKEPSKTTKVSSGIYLRGAIETFTNKGLISGIMGINFLSGTIKTLTNTGTIESTSSNKYAAAINLMTLYGKPSTIDNLTNSGTIKSSSNGIQAEAGNYINTLTNKGTIEADLNGISFYDYGGSGGSGSTMKLGKIILENGSSIKAGNNGINIDNGTSKAIEADGIEV
ncbi:autotransporter outer membrane beta-barrel domain-containing protein, partial [Campylobacter jejuni]|nr:autotransporter outer membrane beta-barrel domain-containing protein [Campylobacter jejuni]